MAYTGTHSGYACLPTKSRTLSTFLSWDSQLLPLFAPVYALNRIASVLRVSPFVALRTHLQAHPRCVARKGRLYRRFRGDTLRYATKAVASVGMTYWNKYIM